MYEYQRHKRSSLSLLVTTSREIGKYAQETTKDTNILTLILINYIVML
jgi:hypothetical protein